MQTLYSNDAVRDMLMRFWEENYRPQFRVLAKEIGITYTYLLEFKNGTRTMGQDGLSRIVSFVTENS